MTSAKCKLLDKMHGVVAALFLGVTCLGAAPAMALSPFLIFFEPDSAEIPPRGDETLREIVRLLPTMIERCMTDRVLIIGFDDTMNSPDESYELGMRRAIAVRNRLLSLRPPEIEIYTDSRGQSPTARPTKSGVSEPLHRRVEITPPQCVRTYRDGKWLWPSEFNKAAK